MTKMITIDGVPMIEPKVGGFKIRTYDADSDSSGRTESYALSRERIYQDAYAIDVTWEGTWAQIQVLCAAISPVDFTVVFMDGTHGVFTTKQMYSGNRSSELVQNLDEAHQETSIWILTVALLDTCTI